MNNQTKKFFIYTASLLTTKTDKSAVLLTNLAELKELARKEDLDVVDVLCRKADRQNTRPSGVW